MRCVGGVGSPGDAGAPTSSSICWARTELDLAMSGRVGTRKESSPPIGAMCLFLIGPSMDFCATLSSEIIGASMTIPARPQRGAIWEARQQTAAPIEHPSQ